MNKKRLIAYILAMSTLAGCHSVKNDEDIKKIEETSPTTVTEINDDVYNCHSKSMSYGADFDIADIQETISKNGDITYQNLLGNFYLVNIDSVVYDDAGDIICNIEKYEKVILINNNVNQNGFAYIQLSNGLKGYIDYSNLNKLSDEVIDLYYDYTFNSFNDNNPKNNNEINYNQPIVYKFIKENTDLFDINGEIIRSLDKYDIVTMIDLNNNEAYVELTDGTRGFINNDLLYRLPESFVEVDISEQTLYAFNDSKLVLKADVVTGNPNIGTTPGTNLGYTEINGTLYNTKLMGGAPAEIFISFNSDGEGFHDARWRNKFGEEIYKTNGSHGCVNMKLEDVKVLDQYAKYGTKVVVHK